MQNTKGKEQNSTEKSGEEYMTLEFKHVLVEMRGTAGLSEPSTSSSSRTSMKNMEQERSVEEDKVSCPQENTQCNNHLKPEDTHVSTTL